MAKVLSTTSRLYLGVFGLLMFPVLSAAIIGFVLCFVAAPPVDIAGILGGALLSAIHGATVVNTLYQDGLGASTFHAFSPLQPEET